MDSAAQVVDLWRHRQGRCPAVCEWCQAESHLFYEADLIFADKQYQAWLQGLCLRDPAAEVKLGGMFAAYATFRRMSVGRPVSMKGITMPGGSIGASSKPKPKGVVTGLRAPRIEVDLPTAPSVISDDMNDYHFLIHGEKKIGKTTLVTDEKGVFVISFDPLRPGLSIMQRHCPDWATFKAYLRKLEEVVADFPYVRVVVDRVDLCYHACLQYVCRDRGIEDPSEEEWGKAWRAIRREFTDVMVRTMSLPCGTWFICHSEWKEVKSASGVKTTKLVPDLTGSAEEILNGMVDGWFAYDYDGEDRVLYIQGDANIGAGHSLDTHFRTPEGEPVFEIPMGNSPAEAWSNFKRAFANEQTKATVQEIRDLNKPKAKPGTATATKPVGSLLKKK